MPANKFYDIHYHALDLSHANITAFLNRLVQDNKDLLQPDFIKDIMRRYIPRWQKLLLPFVPYGVLANKIHQGIQDYLQKDDFKMRTSRAQNLLSFMESAILYDFLIVEHFLKSGGMVKPDNTFKMAGTTFSKMVLVPLVMDFGYKNMEKRDVFYNVPPQKPVSAQVRDLFRAIYTYYHYDMELKQEQDLPRFRTFPAKKGKKDKLFEIYPFMGLNTANYTYKEVAHMLDKYFGDFSGADSPKEREQKLFDRMGLFNGDLEDEPACRNIFAGIKLYPPLGFAPWPEDKEERRKVELLYVTCADKNIPITAHCSTGGFHVTERGKEYTDPGNQWAHVLQKHPSLKINFAHFGYGDPTWQETIIDHVNRDDSLAFTDFSSNGENDAYYRSLARVMTGETKKLGHRMLFGSDFMINLFWLNSYNQYLNYFFNTQHLNDNQKLQYGMHNPRAFLFGEEPV